MERAIILAVLLATLVFAVVETQHFRIHESAPAPDKIGPWLEEAYTYYFSKYLKPMPPCDFKYDVYGTTGMSYTYADKCVVRIELPTNVDMYVLRHIIYHEIGRIFYYSCVSPHVRIWYSEAIPEAMAVVATSNTYWPYRFFYDRMYRQNPYKATQQDWYKWSAVYLNTLLGSGDWRPIVCNPSDNDLVRYLIRIANGDVIGGRMLSPLYVEKTLDGNTTLEGQLDGLTADYYKLTFRSAVPVCVVIQTSDNVVSNIMLNKEFCIENRTLYIAVVNPDRYPTKYTLTVKWRSTATPPPEATTTNTTVPTPPITITQAPEEPRGIIGLLILLVIIIALILVVITTLRK